MVSVIVIEMKRRLGYVKINYNSKLYKQQLCKCPLWGSIFDTGDKKLHGIYFNVSTNIYYKIMEKNMNQLKIDKFTKFTSRENTDFYTEFYKIKIWKTSSDNYQDILDFLKTVKIENDKYKISFDILKDWRFIQDSWLIESL